MLPQFDRSLPRPRDEIDSTLLEDFLSIRFMNLSYFHRFVREGDRLESEAKLCALEDPARMPLIRGCYQMRTNAFNTAHGLKRSLSDFSIRLSRIKRKVEPEIYSMLAEAQKQTQEAVDIAMSLDEHLLSI